MPRRYSLLLLFFGLLAAFIVATVVLVEVVMPSPADLGQLLVFMSATGGATIGLVYLLYRRGLVQWFSSLRWTLLSMSVLTVALVFINVLVTAQLMFISDHDLILTTLLLIFAGLVSVIAVFFISRALTERIDRLAQATELLAQGRLDTRLEVRGNDELVRLAATFNQMAAALDDMERQKAQMEQARRNLYAWISHDLRTPLAAIRAMNEAIIDGVAADRETITRYLYTTQHEIRHLSRLIDDLFELSQMDAAPLKLQREPTSLHDLVSDALGSVSARADQAQVGLSGWVDDDVPLLMLAPDKVARVLYNLLDNALHHTPPGGQVRLRACLRGANVDVQVHNTGSYIPAEEIERIFTSFYRGEESRTQGKGGYRGTGLGLAIARGFVEAHGGRVRVRSDPQAGTIFAFTLPVQAA